MEHMKSEEIKAVFCDKHGATSGQMFGKQCLKYEGKAFIAFFKDDMVFKIGKEAVDKALERFPEAENWDPSGKKRPMKDWLQVPKIYEKDWEELSVQALDYLKSLL